MQSPPVTQSRPLPWLTGLLPAGLLAVAFGVATLSSGGAVLFGSDEARAAAGAYVPFVVWFNFLAGFAYVVTGLGLLLRARWGPRAAAGIAATTALVFAAFGVHVATGSAYEMRTVLAMTLRTTLWVALAIVSFRVIRRHRRDDLGTTHSEQLDS